MIRCRVRFGLTLQGTTSHDLLGQDDLWPFSPAGDYVLDSQLITQRNFFAERTLTCIDDECEGSLLDSAQSLLTAFMRLLNYMSA